MEGITIEVHDLRFVVARDVVEAKELAMREWPGGSAHVDAIQEISEVNGFAISLTPLEGPR